MRPANWICTLPLKLRSLFRRRQVDQELDEELRYHIECKTAVLIAKGMKANRARRAALIDLGGVEQTNTLLGAALVVLLSVAFLAAWIPVRKAARIDPVVALRYEQWDVGWMLCGTVLRWF